MICYVRAGDQYQGFINLIGIRRLGQGGADDTILDYRGDKERFGIVPVSDGLCYWAAAWCEAGDTAKQMRDRVKHTEGWRKELYRRFGGWAEPVRHVLKHHDTTALKAIFVHDLNPLPLCHQENLLLIGDAAHAPLPTSGQGACQALEDAWHLSNLLSGVQCSGLSECSSLDDILSLFYRQRIGKTTMTQTVGREIARQIFTEAGVAPTVRASPAGVSAVQLRDLWMQGLEY